jgi:D-cysteine desulfhydrase
VASIARSSGRPPLQVPPGGSSVAGTLGWVEAGQRLAAWLPGDTPVVVAAGSGGTAAGLWAGGCRVVAVRVSPRAIVNRQRLRRLGRRAGARAGVSAPDRHALQIDARWLAGGYGHVDPTTRRAAELGRSLGLPLETTYTAKAFAAALELLATRRGPVCFVQTASAPPTQPPPPDLPAELRMLCEHAPAAG